MVAAKPAPRKSKYLQNMELDIYQLVWDLTAQVPKGCVTTYGAIAKALGDVRASRAVGMIEHVNPRPIIVPCHRVVYSGGGLGGFGAAEGVRKKIELLNSEGVEITDDKIINFEEILFQDFILPEPAPLERLRAEQDELKTMVTLKDMIPFDKVRTIAGMDASYSYEQGFGAIVVMELNTLEILETKCVKTKIRFPYIPTYLSYHEIPILIKLFEKLSEPPDILILDGNGVLHPRTLGLAAHAGIILQIPTMGIAKKLLCGDLGLPVDGSDMVLEVLLNGRRIGYGFKPGSVKKNRVYVSPGNNLTFETSINIAKKVCKTRIPEPIRIAHKLALEMRRKFEKKKRRCIKPSLSL